MRDEGWYWVKIDGDWACANWIADEWWLAGNAESASDYVFEEIGPRIPTPDEAPNELLERTS